METQPEVLSIGELSRRSGLPVKTIRYYSDVGVLPPATRTPAGYRRYDSADLARLDLVRTLRELGVDLGTVGRVLDRQASLPDVLALHAHALDVQARALQVQRAVLRETVRNGASAAYLARAHRVARLTAAERTAVLHQFLDRVMDGIPIDWRYDPSVGRAYRWLAAALRSADE